MAYLLNAGTVTPTETAVTRQELHNMQQWSNLEAVFSMKSVPISMLRNNRTLGRGVVYVVHVETM